MRIRYVDLLSLKATTADGSKLAVLDVMVGEDDLRADAVKLDAGDWRRESGVGIEGFGEPDPEGGTWPMDDSPRPPDAGVRRSAAAATSEMMVDARDGEAGKLMDLVFETTGWKTAHLIIETGGTGLPENQRVVPAGLVERIDWQAGRVHLAADVDFVHASPDLHEMDGVEGKWYNKVLAYYGLQA